MYLLNYLFPCISKLDATDSESVAYLNMASSFNLIAALLKQSVERIDKVRASAGKVLCDLILSSEHLKFPGHDYLRQYIKR
jgi:hypothetical protein